ncbi:MAG: methylenetetrahydrofolate reductase, partial [Desulfuromonadaceae bacterium]|nr:methylenetetrahydrofolate reductase [Desulfuromonadaceae bacterium]
IAELSPPKGADPAQVRTAAKSFVGKVHALGVSDNRDGVHMSAIAAASLILSEGVEPIIHMTTRDRNRISLVSDCLGAQALGIRNLLCTTGTHQTLGPCSKARNVFDIDSIQLLGLYSGLADDASLVGEERFADAGPFCLGSTASPYADPLEMQIIRIAKAVAAGTQFIITQPVYDVDRFEAWWVEVTRRGLHEKAAIIAGIRPLPDADAARAYAGRRPNPMIPEALVQRISAPSDKSAQRGVGIEIALETIKRLSSLKGLRGFEVRGDGDAGIALECIERSGLGID